MEKQLPMTHLPILRRPLAALAAATLVLLGACSTLVQPPDQTGNIPQVIATAPFPAASAASAPAPEASASAAGAPADAASVPAAESGPAVSAPIDPLRPEESVDLNSNAATIDLWMRLRRGFGMPDLDTPLVRVGEQWYSSRPDYVQRMTERGSRYLFHIVEEVERRGMPTELALLPFIESAFNPQAVSSAQASGMWQFMPATGKHFDLRQNVFRDDRRDVLASTRAALDYLGRLHDMFGDWQLALAAYNWGEGNVQRAIDRNKRAGKPTDYLSLRMPNETAYYVPKLQAVKNIVMHPDAFLLTLPSLENHPYFLSVPIERDIDVDLAIKLAGVTTDEFHTLNPQMNRPVILAAGTPQVLLPYDNASRFVRNISEHRGALATWTAWVAPRTLSPKDAAKQVGMSETLLREVNKIPPRMLVRAGSTLLVPRGENLLKDVSATLADNAVMSLSPEAAPPRRVTVKAGAKETVSTMAKRYRVTPAQVAEWNKVSAGSSFKSGQTVVLYLAPKTVRSAKAKKPTKARATTPHAGAKRSTKAAKR
jgi:membrane-bound lytic murein transglycosylase D